MRRLAIVPAVALVLAACSGDGGGSGDAAQYCAVGAEIFEVNGELAASGDAFDALGEAATEEDFADFRSEGLQLLTEFHELLDEAAAVAPPEIRDAALVMADAFVVVDDGEAAAGAAANPLDDPDVQEANDAVANWAAENC